MENDRTLGKRGDRISGRAIALREKRRSPLKKTIAFLGGRSLSEKKQGIERQCRGDSRIAPTTNPAFWKTIALWEKEAIAL
ncbi:hypothetical protein [Oxynema aestuarii]|uniref:Uncharacterized protein n=1 Tax=Oxynema aestuarii AP17 TaxID=2064643 RepID=A0A6H1TV67_9CYAN|nr:hypothetical protein [Oxynema aestuarii]QIZ69840.1 hypothetical protein HCG48_03970 [Oxynema aestuarii AP17]